MSYESMRLEFADRLNGMATLTVSDVLAALDDVSSSYKIERACTDLIPVDEIPQAVRLYIASKTVEHLARGTLDLYLLPCKSVRIRPCLPILPRLSWHSHEQRN